MPVPGPRSQARVALGYRNPGSEAPDRFQLWLRPPPVADPGRSPGLMVVTRRGCVLAAGQIRRLWRQSVNYIPAQAAFSWTWNAPAPGRPIVAPGALGVTRALRYMTRSVYMGAGIDNTRFEGLHTVIPPRVRSKPVTRPAGGVRGRPTIRNRLTSFGSRVPTLNQPSAAAEPQ